MASTAATAERGATKTFRSDPLGADELAGPICNLTGKFLGELVSTLTVVNLQNPRIQLYKLVISGVPMKFFSPKFGKIFPICIQSVHRV